MTFCLKRQTSAVISSQTLSAYKQTYGIKHHAIPLLENGPDESWNLVYLTVEEHNKAHNSLRFEVYGQNEDWVASAGLSRTDPTFLAQRAFLGHASMKKEDIGFYNSDLQRELARRPRRKTVIREAFYAETMNSESTNEFWSKDHIFLHQNLGLKVAAKGGTVSRTGLLLNVFLENMPDSPERTSLAEDHQKDFSSGWLKVMKGIRHTYKGWSIQS